MGFGTGLLSASKGWSEGNDRANLEQVRAKKLEAMDIKNEDSRFNVDMKKKKEEYRQKQVANAEKALQIAKHKEQKMGQSQIDIAIQESGRGNYEPLRRALTSNDPTNLHKPIKKALEAELGGVITDVRHPNPANHIGENFSEDELTNDAFEVEVLQPNGEKATRLVSAMELGAMVGTPRRVGIDTFHEAMTTVGDTPTDSAKLMSIDFNGNVKNLASNLATVAATTGDERALKLLDVMREVGAKDTQSLGEALAFKILHAKDPEEVASAKAQLKKVQELQKSMKAPTKESALIDVQEQMAKAAREQDGKAYEYWKQKRLDLLKKPEKIMDEMKGKAFKEAYGKSGSAVDALQQVSTANKAMTVKDQILDKSYKSEIARGATPTEAAQTMANSVLKSASPQEDLQRKILKAQMDGKDTKGMQNLHSVLFDGGNALKTMVATAMQSGDPSEVRSILDTVHSMNDKPLENAMRSYFYKASHGDKPGADEILQQIQGSVKSTTKPTAPKAPTKASLSVDAANGDPTAIKALSLMSKSDGNGSLTPDDMDKVINGGFQSIANAIGKAKATQQPALAAQYAEKTIQRAGEHLDLMNNPSLQSGIIDGNTKFFLHNLEAAQQANSKAHTTSSVYVAANKTIDGAKRVVTAVNNVHKIYSSHKEAFDKFEGTALTKVEKWIGKAIGGHGLNDINDMERLRDYERGVKNGIKLKGAKLKDYKNLKANGDAKAFTDMDVTSFLALKSLLQSISGMGVTNQEFTAFESRFKGKEYQNITTMINSLDAVAKDQITYANGAHEDLMGQGAYYDAYKGIIDLRGSGKDFLASSGIDVNDGLSPRMGSTEVSPYNTKIKSLSKTLDVPREALASVHSSLIGKDRGTQKALISTFLQDNPKITGAKREQFLAYINKELP